MGPCGLRGRHAALPHHAATCLCVHCRVHSAEHARIRARSAIAIRPMMHLVMRWVMLCCDWPGGGGLAARCAGKAWLGPCGHQSKFPG